MNIRESIQARHAENLIVELADYHTEIIPMYARYLPALLHTPSLETKTYLSNLSQRLLAEMGSVTYPLAGRVVSFAAEKLGLRRKLHAHKVRQLVRRIKPDVMVSIPLSLTTCSLYSLKSVPV